MLESKDINLFSTYRAKVFEGRSQGPNNDRTVVSIDRLAGTIQYDSDMYGSYDHMARSDESRMLPVTNFLAFLDWAEKELSEKEYMMYYPAKERSDDE